MACKNPQNPDCPNCNKSGLAILPARYAVVPKNINAALPAPMGNKVSEVKLAEHKYALRTLRAGYLYLFHEKHARGSQITWEVYSVSEAGTLWKQLSPGAMQPVLSEPVCSRDGHNMPASVITIESPEKCKRVWIAFSEHAWSDETFKAFAQDSKLRDRRMQTFLPATWIVAGGYRHGLPATKANIEHVLEYKPDFKAGALNGGAVPAISEDSGAHRQAALTIQTTSYPAVGRAGQSAPLAKLMLEIGENSKGKPHQPMVMAVWDAVGITHELNGFRNGSAGWVEKYNAEREQQVSAMMSIEGLKQALSQRAGDRVDDFQQSSIEKTADYGDLQARRANAAKLPAERRARELEACDILEDWQRRKVPSSLFEMRLSEVNRAPEPERSAGLAKLKSEVDTFLAKRAKSATDNVEKARAGSWTKYEDQLAGAPGGRKLYQVFKEHYDKFLAAVDILLNARTVDLVAWLESKYLVDALTEFHGESVEDGIVFDDHIGRAMLGMNSSATGRVKIDAWVSELKTTEHNLVWRAIALNQTANMREVDEFLELARQHATKGTSAGTLDWLTTFSKSLKAFVDTHKKFASMSSSNTDAGPGKISKAFGVQLNAIKARGSDVLMMTVGNRIFDQFRVFGLADRVSEKMIQHMFSIRALVDSVDSLKLIRVQTANDPQARKQALQEIRAARTAAGAGKPKLGGSAHADNLRKGWAEFNKTNPKGPGAMRDARLALLIMLIEGVNFSKLLSDCVSKNDAKTWWYLAASGMTIVSAMFDMASAPVKAVLHVGGDSWSYQRLKLFGGIFSAGAAAVTVVLDLESLRKR